MKKGQIYKIHSDFYYVKCDNEIFECKLRDVIKKTKQSVFVGDFVEFDNSAIEKILQRNRYIPRPSVANVNKIIIVSSIKEPDLDFLQLNRYISFAKYYNIDTLLCFNKNDLSENDEIIEKVFSIYEPLGFDIIFTSATEKYGLEELKKVLKGNTSVLCGASGVGKSSLINAICKRKLQRTGSVSDKTHKGTHTTRHCEIIETDIDTRIVDTPGFSNLKFDFLMPNEISSLFEEINVLKNECKFPDCLHINENNCAIKSNLGKSIDLTRYESYVAFTEEAMLYKKKIQNNGKKTETLQKNNNNKTVVKLSVRKRQSARNTNKQKILKDLEDERINKISR